MALTLAAIFLFRRGACRHRFTRQSPWILAGLAIGFIALYLPHGLTFLNILIVCLALFFYTSYAAARGREPQFAQLPVYHGGLFYLIVLNSFAVRCDYVGAAACAGLFTIVYLAVKLLSRGHEYNTPVQVLNTVPRKDSDDWPPNKSDFPDR